MAMMISKFHKIIQSKVVWTAFAILISVAFVGVYTGARTSGTKQENPGKKVVGKLYGEEVTRAEFNRAFNNVMLMYTMMTGRQPQMDEETNKFITDYAWQRLATLKKADQMGLSVTSEQVIDMIKRQPIFMNRETMKYDAQAYNGFVNGFLPSIRMNNAMFEKMMAENVLIEKASSVAAQGALVTDTEIKEAFHLYQDKTTVEYAAIPRSLVDPIEVSDEAAKQYFDANKEKFRIPEKAIVKYVAFNVMDFTNKVTVADETVAQAYERSKDRFIKPETATNSVPEYKPLEEVKGEIVEQLTENMARQEAFNAADAIVAQLSNPTITFEQAAKEAGLRVVDNTPAFGATDSVPGVDPTAPFARMAFALEQTESHYYSDPIVGRYTIYVAALVKKLPPKDPEFESVKADVVEATRMDLDEKAYIEKVDNLHAEIEKALKAGTSFADAAAPYNLDLKTTEPFNATTPLEDQFGREIMTATAEFDAGTLVDLIQTSDAFLIAYVAKKDKADETVDLPAMREELAAGIRNEKASSMRQAWQESLLKEANFVDLSEKPAEKDTDS